MKRFRFFLVGLVLFGGSLATPTSVFAQSTSCNCWCSFDQLGAVDHGEEASPFTCSLTCEDLGAESAICSPSSTSSAPEFSSSSELTSSPTSIPVSTPALAPIANLRCWTEEECIQGDGKWAPEQPLECAPKFHYCLSKSPPVDLNVAIGDKKVVMGLEDYIATMFNWLMGATAVFAVLMIIVGGVQYIVSGGVAGAVKAAMDRIKMALIGVVILLGIYLILGTVNPQLLRLELPPIPRVKPVFQSGTNTTCESFYGSGYAVKLGSSTFQSAERNDARLLSANNTRCGVKATVTEDASGNPVSDAACYFSSCPNPAVASCRVDTNEEDGLCRPCEAFKAEEGFTPAPSDGLCRSFTERVQTGVVTQCRYVEKRFLINEGQGACVSLQTDCGTMETCEEYNNVILQSEGSSNVSLVSGTQQDETSQKILEELCTGQVGGRCGVNVNNGGCQILKQAELINALGEPLGPLVYRCVSKTP